SNIVPKDLPLVQQAIAEASQGYQDIQVSFRVMHHDQSVVHVDCLGEATYDDKGEILKITGSAQDISRLHKAETLIDYQSNHDVLTDLPNRAFFNRSLANFLETPKPKEKGLSAVVILDIDRFKKINDTLGQENGDGLLRNVALRLKRVTREEDDVARLGSDEFAILIKQARDSAEMNMSINRIFQDISKVFVVDGNEHFITFSMGVCVVEPGHDSANELIANANVARTEAKYSGGNQFMFYQSDMNAEARTQLMLENDLRKALERKEIEVYFQPQVDAKTLEVTGAEALARWNHPSEGVVSPGVFIPLAESTGLIVDIGRYVLKAAVREAERWQNHGFEGLNIGINLSGRQFTHSNLMKDIQGVLTETTIPASCIDLEITESLAMSNADRNISILKGLKAMGVSLSIDDFGTGYSSLAYLQSFPIDNIKIDRSFIVNLETVEGQAIVNTILAMAESLQLGVVAEGIEEDFHVDFLQNKNCRTFQGYKFGKPMTANRFFDFLKSHEAVKAEAG
ncbi:MAG: GGDEF and EAL domain-containing protein, partial [Hydrogenovibrio sp.]|nr:GGDEF and EAL domain-containing protein [Hydrogenovibrio sp.]